MHQRVTASAHSCLLPLAFTSNVLALFSSRPSHLVFLHPPAETFVLQFSSSCSSCPRELYLRSFSLSPCLVLTSYCSHRFSLLPELRLSSSQALHLILTRYRNVHHYYRSSHSSGICPLVVATLLVLHVLVRLATGMSRYFFLFHQSYADFLR